MVKGPDIYWYTPPLRRKPEQQRFTIRSGVLTSNSIKDMTQF